ncbi:hypothetical protein [Aestuariivirga sp.]|uniref:hypothetical protein n=1 Tax=Aestuariivirga sp. TaxID=2650926 RepID=UPI003593A5F2
MPKTLSASGPAVLRFSDGQSVSVDARLTLNRNFFSVSGEGEFVTDNDTASRAFLADDPILLTMDETASAHISVHEAKTAQSSSRCWFRVHS